jgi:hypothetical protein
VQSWLTGLPPVTKHRVRLPLRGLAKGRGDIKGLIGPLTGFNRLRVGGLRIIIRQISAKEIQLEYANNRDVIYELYREILASKVSPH